MAQQNLSKSIFCHIQNDNKGVSFIYQKFEYASSQLHPVSIQWILQTQQEVWKSSNLGRDHLIVEKKLYSTWEQGRYLKNSRSNFMEVRRLNCVIRNRIVISQSIVKFIKQIKWMWKLGDFPENTWQDE